MAYYNWRNHSFRDDVNDYILNLKILKQLDLGQIKNK